MELELGQLLTAIGQSVSEAQNALSRHAIESYLDYFQPADGGGCRPKTTDLALPLSGAEQTVAVPLVALSSHGHLELAQVNIRLRVAARTGDAGEMLVELRAPDKTEAATPQTELALTFERQEPAEGIARLVTEINKVL